MKSLSRRKALNTLLTAGAGVTLASNILESATANDSQQTTPATTMQLPMAFRGQHQPKPLPFDPAKLKGLSEKLIRSHWENNYGGAVKALNAVEQRLDMMLKDKDLPPYLYGDVKREELIRTGSVILHDHYFANL